METITIGEHTVGPDAPTFVIAEVAQAHDGSLGLAHSYIDAVAETGADAIKFQTHFARQESTLDEPFRVPFAEQDESRYDYWERMEFTPEQWEGLATHAREEGLVFLSSPFSKRAVDVLSDLNVPAWKLGSGEYDNAELASYAAARDGPVLLSTGMARYDEIDDMVRLFEEAGTQYGLFQCTSKYPTSIDEVGWNVVEELRNRHNCPVGLSDHTGSPHPGLMAISRGIDMLEVHVTFDRRMFGPDVEASVTIDELETMCTHRDTTATIESNPVDKDEMATALERNRELFSRSIAPSRSLSAGTKLEADMITPKKPGTGIPYAKKSEVIGRELTADVDPDRLLTWEDIDE
jgi:N,N'-diacetyllegionaminate synthase